MISSQPVPFVSRSAFGSSLRPIDVHLDRRLGERKIARTEANLPFLSEQPAGEGGDRALQVGHGDVFADDQALDLLELDFAAGGDRLIAVAHAGQNDADRLGAQFAHDVDLAGRGVRAQDHARRGGVKRVPHVAGRVVRRHVEQFEVGQIVFDFPAAIDLKAQVGEDGHDLAA